MDATTKRAICLSCTLQTKFRDCANCNFRIPGVSSAMVLNPSDKWTNSAVCPNCHKHVDISKMNTCFVCGMMICCGTVCPNHKESK